MCQACGLSHKKSATTRRSNCLRALSIFAALGKGHRGVAAYDKYAFDGIGVTEENGIGQHAASAPLEVW